METEIVGHDTWWHELVNCTRSQPAIVSMYGMFTYIDLISDGKCRDIYHHTWVLWSYGKYAMNHRPRALSWWKHVTCLVRKALLKKRWEQFGLCPQKKMWPVYITRSYPPVILHSNGKSTIWRCISYSRWGFSIAMFVYRRVCHLPRCDLVICICWRLGDSVCVFFVKGCFTFQEFGR